MKRTYQPNVRKRAKKHGFRKRMSPEGPRTPLGVSTGIRRRSTFAALRADGRRVRRRGLAIVYLPTPAEPTQVAFAISRRAGTAVHRNRCRRRLRAVLDARERAGLLPAGVYLISVQPQLIDASHHELAGVLDELLGSLRVAA
jgi:ribonuclease P protein component